jgi:hypothetical protein
MAFEIFANQQPRIRDSMTITVTSRGSLVMSPAAHAAISKPRTVDLLFDRDKRFIGIRPSESHDGYLVTSKLQVTCRGFTKHYDIPTEKAIRRTASVQDGVLFVDLNDPGVVVTSNRSGTGRTDLSPTTEEPGTDE